MERASKTTASFFAFTISSLSSSPASFPCCPSLVCWLPHCPPFVSTFGDLAPPSACCFQKRLPLLKGRLPFHPQECMREVCLCPVHL